MNIRSPKLKCNNIVYTALSSRNGYTRKRVDFTNDGEVDSAVGAVYLRYQSYQDDCTA